MSVKICYCIKTSNIVTMTVSSCHVMYTFQSESTLYSFLNVKELLARSRREIWRLSDCNWTRTQNHLVRKQTFNHLAKLTCWVFVYELSGSGFESSCCNYDVLKNLSLYWTNMKCDCSIISIFNANIPQ